MLKLVADPSFTSAVKIPTPSGEVAIKVEYKHMTKDAYDAFVRDEAKNPRSDEDAIMDIAKGWHGVEGEFTRENVRALCQVYHAAPRAIVETFIRELTQHKLGN
jgi:CO dehydrogenase/acetyl-CoA synthase alpha subunit